MASTLKTAPIAKPFELPEVKVHCSVDLDITEYDDMFARMIGAAMYRFETFTHRSLLKQTRQMGLDSFFTEIRLDRGKILGDPVVKYYDVTGAQQTLDASYYIVDTISTFPTITLAPGKTYPLTQRRKNAVIVEWPSGIASDPSGIPDDICQALLHMIETWFDNRGTILMSVDMRYQDYPEIAAAQQMLFPYKLLKT